MSIRKLAKSQPCFMRLEGCTHDNEQTVLAHIRRGNSRAELDAEALRALGQWLDWLWRNEYLIAVA